MKRRILPIAAAALSLAAALPTTAGAAKDKPVTPAAEIISHVKTLAGGEAATVKARYVCPEGFHLWISAKQAEGGKQDPRLEEEGSSRYSAAWLQNHPTAFTCDGKWHTGTYQVDKSEYGFGRLQRGVAWVQFCLVGESTFLSRSEWVKVN